MNHHDRTELRPIDVKDRMVGRNELEGKTIETLMTYPNYGRSGTLIKFTDGTYTHFNGIPIINYAHIPWDKSIEIGLVTKEEKEKRWTIVEKARKKRQEREKREEIRRMKETLERYAKEQGVDLNDIEQEADGE